jgi:hypothetical protein
MEIPSRIITAARESGQMPLPAVASGSPSRRSCGCHHRETGAPITTNGDFLNQADPLDLAMILGR